MVKRQTVQNVSTHNTSTWAHAHAFLFACALAYWPALQRHVRLCVLRSFKHVNNGDRHERQGVPASRLHPRDLLYRCNVAFCLRGEHVPAGGMDARLPHLALLGLLSFPTGHTSMFVLSPYDNARRCNDSMKETMDTRDSFVP